MVSLKGGSGARTRITSLQQTPIRSLTSLSLWWSKSFFDRDLHRGANWDCNLGSWFSTDNALSACCVFLWVYMRETHYNLGFRYSTEKLKDIKPGITMPWFWPFTCQASYQSLAPGSDKWEMQPLMLVNCLGFHLFFCIALSFLFVGVFSSISFYCKLVLRGPTLNHP